jgi:hypothetical protein
MSRTFKLAFITITLFFAAFFAHSDEGKRVYRDHALFLMNAPDDLASIPTTYQNPAFLEKYNAYMENELRRLYQADSRKSPGRYNNRSNEPLTPHALGYAFEHSEAYESYETLIRAYNKANAFEKRRMKKEFDALLGVPLKDVPLAGEQALIAVRPQAAFEFDFDTMSKSLVFDTAYCEEKGGFITGAMQDDIMILIQPFGELEGRDCVVTIPFDDVELAEKFEDALSDNEMKVYLKTTVLPTSIPGRIFAVGDELVFARRSEPLSTNTYKVSPYSTEAITRQGEVTQTFYGFNFLHRMQAKKERYNHKNLLQEAAFPNLPDPASQEMLVQTTSLFNLMQKDGLVLGKPNEHYIKALSDGVFRFLETDYVGKDDAFGAVADYQLVLANESLMAIKLRSYQYGDTLPHVLVITKFDADNGLLIEFGDLTSIRRTRPKMLWLSRLPDGSEEKMTSDLKFNEEAMRTVKNTFDYDHAISPWRDPVIYGESVDDDTQKETAAAPQKTGKTEHSGDDIALTEPPFNMACAFKNVQTAGSKKSLTAFKAEQPLPENINPTSLFQSILDYSMRTSGQTTEVGRQGDGWMEILQPVGRGRVISTVYTNKGTHLKIHAAFPKNTVPGRSAVEGALCQMMEAI